MRIDGYIPVDILREARDFVEQMNHEVDLMKMMKTAGLIQTTPEADAFMAWWNIGQYTQEKNALAVLYEHDQPITDFYGPFDAQSAKDFAVYRMESFYQVLLDNGMIHPVKEIAV